MALYRMCKFLSNLSLSNRLDGDKIVSLECQSLAFIHIQSKESKRQQQQLSVETRRSELERNTK